MMLRGAVLPNSCGASTPIREPKVEQHTLEAREPAAYRLWTKFVPVEMPSDAVPTGGSLEEM